MPCRSALPVWRLGGQCGVAVLLAILTLASSSVVDDYWSSSFDLEANCRNEDLVVKLMDTDQCSSFADEDDNIAFVNCRKNLNKLLVRKCDPKVEKAGELLYCKKRGVINCCFHNFVCFANWSVISNTFSKPAVSFLRNTTKALKDEQNLGYKACHRIEGYDASQCAKDCEEAEESIFAKNCTENGGFFKCCIRRDKKSCDSCRFCCSLPLCTTQTDRGLLQTTDVTYAQEDQNYEQSALDRFNLLESMYKSSDYRCLKPVNDKEPAEWPHYHHPDFQSAVTKDQLEKARTIDFDINFMNLESPEVFQRFLSEDGPRLWKETYGIDFAAKIEKSDTHYNEKDGTSKVELTAGFSHCFEEEMGKFGKQCKKKGGYFKCCVLGMDISPFHGVNWVLASQGLGKKPATNLCLVDREKYHDCLVVLSTTMCSTKDPTTGNLTNEFKIPTQLKYMVGGNYIDNYPELGGLRTMYCTQFLPCEGEAIKLNPFFEQIHDRDSHCKAIRSAWDLDKKSEKSRLPNVPKFLKRSCSRHKYNSAFLCSRQHKHDGIGKSELAVAKSYKRELKKIYRNKHPNSGKSKRRKRKKRSRGKHKNRKRGKKKRRKMQTSKEHRRK